MLRYSYLGDCFIYATMIYAPFENLVKKGIFSQLKYNRIIFWEFSLRFIYIWSVFCNSLLQLSATFAKINHRFIIFPRKLKKPENYLFQRSLIISVIVKHYLTKFQDILQTQTNVCSKIWKRFTVLFQIVMVPLNRTIFSFYVYNYKLNLK